MSGGFNDNTIIDYCIADDASVGSARNNNQYTMIFEDAADDDYHPGFVDLDARGTGKSMIGDTYFPFSVDAAAVDRGRLWDVGALEYLPEKIVYPAATHPARKIHARKSQPPRAVPERVV